MYIRRGTDQTNLGLNRSHKTYMLFKFLILLIVSKDCLVRHKNLM